MIINKQTEKEESEKQRNQNKLRRSLKKSFENSSIPEEILTPEDLITKCSDRILTDEDRVIRLQIFRQSGQELEDEEVNIFFFFFPK